MHSLTAGWRSGKHLCAAAIWSFSVLKKREACGAEKSDWPADFQLQNAPGVGASENRGVTGGGKLLSAARFSERVPPCFQ